jgi:gamma-glutamylcyclotransferase (GGCT)/AIG2-like uncharacterized protein YtfP
MNKVFVYGSLLSGLGNHGLLTDSTFIGKTLSPPEFAMLDLGSFPGVIHLIEGGKSVIGEVYEVDDVTFLRLDRLEGYSSHDPKSGLYNRMEIDTEFGKAFIYTYNDLYGRSYVHPVEDGDWRTYHDKKFMR